MSVVTSFTNQSIIHTPHRSIAMPRRPPARAAHPPEDTSVMQGLADELEPVLQRFLEGMHELYSKATELHSKATELHRDASEKYDAVRYERDRLEVRVMQRIDRHRTFIEQMAEAFVERSKVRMPRAEQLEDEPAPPSEGSVGSAGRAGGDRPRDGFGPEERRALEAYDAYGYVVDPKDPSKRTKECWRVVDSATTKREGMAVAKKLLGAKNRGFNFSKTSAYYRCVQHEGCACVYRVRKKTVPYHEDAWFVAKRNFEAHEEKLAAARREARNA